MSENELITDDRKTLTHKIVMLEDQLKLYRPLVQDLAALPAMKITVDSLQAQVDRLKEVKENNEIRFAKFEAVYSNIEQILCEQKKVNDSLSSLNGRLIKLESQSGLCKDGIEKMQRTIEGFQKRGMDALVKVLVNGLPWIIAVVSFIFGVLAYLKYVYVAPTP